jgi:predicted nucleic acid-binding protein
MLFIYYIEDNPEYAQRVNEIFDLIAERKDILCTSVLSMGEVLAKPKQLGAESAVSLIRDFFLKSGRVELIPFTANAAEQFSMIRATTKLSPADAIHLATAIESDVDIFITHDGQLQKLKMPGIPFITGLDLKLF